MKIRYFSVARQASPFYWIPCLLQCAITDCTLARNDETEECIRVYNTRGAHVV
ncbi:MAG: hypothetical protein K0U39_06350 [Alphaproteobacteria bacterium]|nr:hypothetical protein [Alphaproteobacteria bacterium]